ncbi:MAG: 23S rRNA (adenine(2503)-C(2))-methyltransferase RlmN [Candidatus Faecimonas sp.]|nr:23S rRNA (adenine(2503)-C(2))-methyltransferase RlmN [Mycoplasmatota bacterium]MDY2908718.1 23S rRNA (adenine(2503)-C(2))-methyltransferase RlmN [Candidatus Faecimonas sp.]
MNIYNLTREELEEYFISHDSKKFHANQLFSWLYEKRISSIFEVTDIKKEMLEQLSLDFSFSKLDLVQVERDIDVCKYLFELSDGEHIEAVLMKHDYGNSVCISSQVGCNMGCKFCESGRRKKVRNLETWEMVTQLLMIEEDLKARVSHVVVMGIGEPFDNYDNLLRFFQIINHPKGLAIGARHITVSTCGIVPKILEFSHFPLQINLAISLHAPNDKLRNQIMPINRAYPLKELLPALEEYLKRTNRRITFEYIMLAGINDTDECAKELVKLVGHLNCYINLIPYNETNNLEFKRSSTVQIMRFYDILKKNRLNVTIRREFGSKISAACGQLRSKKEEI